VQRLERARERRLKDARSFFFFQSYLPSRCLSFCRIIEIDIELTARKHGYAERFICAPPLVRSGHAACLQTRLLGGFVPRQRGREPME